MFKERFFSFQTEIKERLFGKNGEIHVLSGPFLGMKYFNDVFYSSATPRWLGTYEMELNPVMEEISQRGYQAIIDVGSAEGYYAVGLARRCPQAEVYAFDVDPISREQCRRLSRLNRVDARVHVSGLLKPRDVARLAVMPTLIICDIEGFEMTLLDPQVCPAMKACDLLVEIHELAEFGGQVESTLGRRFAGTHQIQAFGVIPRTASAAASLFPGDGPAGDIERAMEEHRSSSQQWLWMKSQSRLPV